MTGFAEPARHHPNFARIEPSALTVARFPPDARRPATSLPFGGTKATAIRPFPKLKLRGTESGGRVRAPATVTAQRVAPVCADSGIAALCAA
jgi:hypothetical protein